LKMQKIIISSKSFSRADNMGEDEFWKIISMLNWKYTGNDEKICKKAKTFLMKKSNEDIMKFYDILSKKLYDLDGIQYARNIGEDSYEKNQYFSVDNFLYARCVVVANGRDFYYRVLNNPSTMPKDMEFEALLYLADDAYKKKNKKAFDYSSAFSYETFSNKVKWNTE
jgi:hypothetical protein